MACVCMRVSAHEVPCCVCVCVCVSAPDQPLIAIFSPMEVGGLSPSSLLGEGQNLDPGGEGEKEERAGNQR